MILLVAGVAVDSNWETFIPDLITGVVGAGAISATIAWAQYASDIRRARNDRITFAYERLFESASALRSVEFPKTNIGTVMADLGTRMIQLTEVVVPRRTELEKWFEAERQLGIYYIRTSMEALDVAGPVSEERKYEIVSPYLKWTSEFGHNLRGWRNGTISLADMRDQANRIESILRGQNAWRDSPLPWRADLV